MSWLSDIRNKVGKSLTVADDSIDWAIADTLAKLGYTGYQKSLVEDSGIAPTGNPITDSVIANRDYASKPAADLSLGGAMADSAQQGSLFTGAADTAIRAVPGGSALLDSVYRGWGTAFTVAQSATHVQHEDGFLDSLKDVANTNTWSRAWDQWGTDQWINPGQYLASWVNSDDDRVIYGNPFDSADARAIQNASDDTWYGTVAGAATDLAANVAVPGVGAASALAKGAREAKTLQTYSEVQDVAAEVVRRSRAGEGFNEVSRSTKAKQAVQRAVGAPLSPGDHLDRMAQSLRRFDGITDEVEMSNKMGPMLEDADEAAKPILYNVFTQINRNVPDPTLRDQMRVNALLAVHGSTLARSMLADDAALVARNLQMLTANPRDIAVQEDLWRRRPGGSDVPVSAIIEKHYNTSGDKAELDSLRDWVQASAADAANARQYRAQLAAGKPSLQNFDAARLKEVRAKSKDHAASTLADLRAAQAEQREGVRLLSQARKTGDQDRIADVSRAYGQAQQKAAEAKAAYDQAVADRSLFHSTPLPGMEELGAWRSQMADAQRGVSEANANNRWATALERQASRSLRARRAQAAQLAQNLTAQNDALNDLLDLGTVGASASAGVRFEATNLDRLKAWTRARTEDYHYMVAGDGNTIVKVGSLPTRAMVKALAPRARGRINLNEADLGRRQLADAMARAKVYTPEEIREKGNEFLRTRPHERQQLVDKVQDEMLGRIAQDLFKDTATPADALKAAKELTGAVVNHFRDGHDYALRTAEEQRGSGLIMLRDPDGQITAYDEAMLRPHLADHAPFYDPDEFRKLLARHGEGLRANVASGMHTASGLVDGLTYAWKVGALARPGLMVRAALDTNARMFALLSTGESLMTAINGMANVVHNAGLKGLAKINYAGLDPAQAAFKVRSVGLTPGKEIDFGNGVRYRPRFAQDQADQASTAAALSKGQTPHEALWDDTRKTYAKLKLDMTKWSERQADSVLWPEAYGKYATQLAASPSARKLADLLHGPDVIDADEAMSTLMGSRQFREEYRTFAQPAGRTRQEFAQQLIHEVGNMFPSSRIWEAAKDGRLAKKLIEDEFPHESRFNIPTPEMSSLEQGGWAKRLNRAVDRMFETFLDKPDMWMARNPTAVALYKRQLGAEVRALKDSGKEVTFDDLRKVDQRARSRAINDVRRTFFDTSRSTNLTNAVRNVSPFFMAWEDAAMSWGRLIYDDPSRAYKLATAYNAPATLNAYLPQPFLVDNDGNAIRRGQKHDGAYMVVPFRVNGMESYRVRLDSINSIFQGETWWLPGTGPVATLPVSVALTRFLPKDAALDIVGTDNWLGQQVLKSMYVDGELPRGSLGQLAQSQLPGWVRAITNDAFGSGFAANTQTNFNYRVAMATRNGQTLTEPQLKKLHQQAQKAAWTAAVVRVVASAGAGMTGSGAVDGQFYANQYHIIAAMPENGPGGRGGLSAEEYFAQKYPEAADLNWSISKNDSGLQATVKAEKGWANVQSLAKGENKDLSWMILGRENLVTDPNDPDQEFSRSAYNMQLDSGLRTKQSEQEVMDQAQAAVGWKNYNAWTQELLAQAKAAGIPEDDDRIGDAKRAIREYLIQNNASFAKDYSDMNDRRSYYLSQARRLSEDPKFANRSDFVAFKEYDEARAQVMEQLGIGSLDGTTGKYVQARAALKAAGETLAKQDLGFSQMWSRFLSSEVDDE